MAKLSSKKEYTLREIFDLQVIPGVKKYADLYNLVTEPEEVIDPEGAITAKKIKRVLRTDEGRLPATDSKHPFNVKSVYVVAGEDLIRYVKQIRRMGELNTLRKNKAIEARNQKISAAWTSKMIRFDGVAPKLIKAIPPANFNY